MMTKFTRKQTSTNQSIDVPNMAPFSPIPKVLPAKSAEACTTAAVVASVPAPSTASLNVSLNPPEKNSRE